MKRSKPRRVYSEQPPCPSPSPSGKDPSFHSLPARSRIKLFRVLLLLALVATGVISGVLAHSVLSRKEDVKYHSEFDAAVAQVFLGVDEGFNAKVLTLDHVSTIYSYQCPDAFMWPNCTLPLLYFEDVISDLLDVSSSRSIASNPIVHLHQKDSFEDFAYDFFDRENFPPNTGISSFGRGFYAKYENGSRYADDGRTTFSNYELFVPVFQPAQVHSNWPGIMYNMHSEPTRATAIDAVLDCVANLQDVQKSGSSIVQRCTAVSDFIQLVSDSSPSPASIIYTPVFPLHDNTTIVGINTIIFNWDTILETTEQFVHRSIDCEVETSVGGVSLTRRTFELSSGTANYKGDGVHHSSSDPNERISHQLSYGTELATSVTYTLHFQPNSDFYHHYHSSIPIWASVVCVTITLFISTTFMFYDLLVKREALENKMLLDSKRVFVRFVSHEIRTPINTITLGLQLLATRLRAIDTSALKSKRGSIDKSACSGDDNEESASAMPQIVNKHVLDVMALDPAVAYPSKRSGSLRRSMTRLAPSDTVTECLQLVGELAESSKTAVVVLNELISYDKIEMEKFEVERRVVDVLTVLRETYRPLEVQAQERNVNLSFHCEPGMEKEIFVIGDAVKLGQVYRNVLSNALKFTPVDGTVKATVRRVRKSGNLDSLTRLDPVSGDEYSTAGDIVFTVTDTGPGLSTEQQKKTFQEGVQFNANELQAGGGSGLGLWISKEIIKQHGGFIAVMSEGLGKGATFSVTVPVLLPVEGKSIRSNRYLVSGEQGDTELLSVEVPSRVLIVDDAMTSVKILSRLLANAGMEVCTAFNGKECLDIMKDCTADDMFDLIIMDYEMPVLNGPAATRALRESGYTVPIIGVTGNVLQEDREYFFAAGANAVLPKPLNLPFLLKAYTDVIKKEGIENV